MPAVEAAASKLARPPGALASPEFTDGLGQLKGTIATLRSVLGQVPGTT